MFYFEKKDPRFLLVAEELFLSRRRNRLLLNQDIYIVHQLIIIVIYTPEDLLEIEGLGAKDRDEIVRKVHYFINHSYTLTDWFFSNSQKLKFLPEWYIILLKRKDPRVMFIPELGLSRRVTVLLIQDGIYMIEELIMNDRNLHSRWPSRNRRFGKWR